MAGLGRAGEPRERFGSHPRAVLIPVVSEVKAGAAWYALDAWRWLWVDRLYPVATFAVQVSGDSVWLTLRDGDIAVCREAGEVVSGGIYVVGVKDHATVKRLKRAWDELYMLADNPETDWVAGEGAPRRARHRPGDRDHAGGDRSKGSGRNFPPARSNFN